MFVSKFIMTIVIIKIIIIIIYNIKNIMTITDSVIIIYIYIIRVGPNAPYNYYKCVHTKTSSRSIQGC